MSDKSFEPILPDKNETAVITSKLKTAALYYDRVWCPPKDEFFGKTPKEILFFGATEQEEEMINSGFHTGKTSMFNPVVKPESFSMTEILEDGTFGKKHLVPKAPEAGDTMTEEQVIKKFSVFLFKLINCSIRDIAISLTEKYKIPVATLFPDAELQNLSYQEGDKEIIAISMENLKIVDEENLTWEQVLELRNDKQSKGKYKRFIHWLDKEMVGKSQAFIEDDISIKLNDYEEALKKHGIKTVIGTVKEILDSKSFLTGTALTSGAVGVLSQEPLLALIAGGGLVVSNIAIKLAEKKFAFKELETGKNSEISWVYEVKKKTKKQ